METDGQQSTAVEAIRENASNGESASELVESSEEDMGSEVERVIGDTAYGSMEVRQDIGEREVIAPTVKPHSKRWMTNDLAIDLEHDRVVCLEGHETTEWGWAWVSPGAGEPEVRLKRFAFPKALCRACPRRAECYTDKRERGRTVRCIRTRLDRKRRGLSSGPITSGSSIANGWWWNTGPRDWCSWTLARAATSVGRRRCCRY